MDEFFPILKWPEGKDAGSKIWCPILVVFRFRRVAAKKNE